RGFVSLPARLRTENKKPRKQEHDSDQLHLRHGGSPPPRSYPIPPLFTRRRPSRAASSGVGGAQPRRWSVPWRNIWRTRLSAQRRSAADTPAVPRRVHRAKFRGTLAGSAGRARRRVLSVARRRWSRTAFGPHPPHRLKVLPWRIARTS